MPPDDYLFINPEAVKEPRVTTIRRIYAYLLAFAGLAMVSLAAANLLQLLVDLALSSPV